MANYSLIENKTNGEQAEIFLKIPKEVFVARKNKVFTRLTKNMTVTGFRPGKAPKAMLEARLGADLYEQTLNELLPEVTYEFLLEQKLDFLGRINYEVSKVSEDDGVEYKITFVKYPEFKLPDFKKIKVNTEKAELTEEEVQEELEKIIKYRKPETEEKAKSAKDDKPAKITDEQVKELGLGLNSLKELEDLVREQLLLQKRNIATNKMIQTAVDEAIKLAKIEAPETLVEQEVHKKEHDYQHRVEDLGLKLEDFLTTQNTTLEELGKTWKEEAQRQIKTDLLLFEIAKRNDLKATNEEVNAELAAIADENLKKQYSSYDGRTYISGVLVQQKALQWIMKETGIANSAE